MRYRTFFFFCACCAFLGGCGPQKAPAPDVSEKPITAPVQAEHPDAAPLLAQAQALCNGESCTQPEKALALVEQALALDGENSTAHAVRGLALSNLGQREAAFDALTIALRRMPTAQMYAWRGLTSLRGDMPGAARRDAEYALSKDKSQPDAWNVLGLVELQAGNISAACTALAQGCANGRCAPLENARQQGQCR